MQGRRRSLLYDADVTASRRQGQRHSVAQLCRALAAFAKSRLGVDPLQQQRAAVPFFCKVNASLGGGWMGRGDDALDASESAAPAPQTAAQVESLRKALQLRHTARSKQTSLPPHSPLQPLLSVPQPQRALSAA